MFWPKDTLSWSLIYELSEEDPSQVADPLHVGSHTNMTGHKLSKFMDDLSLFSLY